MRIGMSQIENDCRSALSSKKCDNIVVRNSLVTIDARRELDLRQRFACTLGRSINFCHANEKSARHRIGVYSNVFTIRAGGPGCECRE